MTQREIIDYCLTYSDAYEDYPFDDITPVLRHFSNNKMFALIGKYDGRPYINLRGEPLSNDFLRQMYKISVTPGYHMNKKYWNSVYYNEIPIQEVKQMIEDSFNLTKSNKK